MERGRKLVLVLAGLLAALLLACCGMSVASALSAENPVPQRPPPPARTDWPNYSYAPQEHGRMDQPAPSASTTPPAGTASVLPPTEDPPSAYYANCAEARRAGVAPLRVGEPGYRKGLDRDGNGVACE